MKKMLLALVTLLSVSISAFAAVNLNTATQAELESLKNVGPVKAQAIIDYRKKNGGFKTVEDLNNVPGIGDKTMETLKGEISVSGATTVTAPAAKDTKPATAKEEKKAKPEVAAPAAKPAAADAKAADTAKADKAAAAKAEKDAAKAKAKADKEAAKAEKDAAKAKEKADKAAAKEAAKAEKAAKADKATPAADAKTKAK